MSGNVFVKRSVLTVVCGMAAFVFLPARHGATAANEGQSLETGFRQMYNLQFQAAHRTFEAWKHSHPDDPLGFASDAAAYLFEEFERLHVLDFDFVADGKQAQDVANVVPDPQIKESLERELARADEFADKALANVATDTDALFAKMLSRGLRGDYAALIEKRSRVALGFLKSSRSFAEKLIAIDPNCHDAYLANGIENYELGLRSAPTRWMLRLSGAQTNRSEGLTNLKITAEIGR